MKDIEKELNHYDFTGMKIYCPCDGEQSNFVKYLTSKYDDVIYTSDDFMKHDDLWEQADIIITNPPFSLVRKFFNRCMEFGKNFLFVIPSHAVSYVNILPYLITSECKTGYYQLRDFIRPDENIKRQTSYWLTNLEVNKPIKEIEPVLYSDNHYDYIDGTNIINVNKIKEIPCDYFGEMGVPITILKDWNADEFEFIKIMQSPYVNGKNIFARIVIKRKEYE